MSVRVLLWVVVGLLAAVLVAVVVVAGQLQQQDAQADYERCLAVRGITPETAGQDLDAAIAAAEACSD